jgi:hypothetical protein
MPNKSKSDFEATEDREDPVLTAFLATEECEEWQDFGDAAEKIYENESLETIEVPTAWRRRVLPEIRNDPMIFRAMVDVWNRECDRLGMPGRKMKNTPQRAEEDGNDGPF